jgi:hypothetical protein
VPKTECARGLSAQAVVALWRERMDWDLTPRQAALQRMRERWA